MTNAVIGTEYPSLPAKSSLGSVHASQTRLPQMSNVTPANTDTGYGRRRSISCTRRRVGGRPAASSAGSDVLVFLTVVVAGLGECLPVLGGRVVVVDLRSLTLDVL